MGENGLRNVRMSSRAFHITMHSAVHGLGVPPIRTAFTVKKRRHTIDGDWAALRR
jgi:hypothetical protein